MTTLRVIIDDMLSPVPGEVSRYTEELTKALIATAPSGCDVEGIVAASSEAQYAAIMERLPGLTGLFKSPFARRELTASWQHGFTTVPGGGMVHATSLFAPLKRHDRVNGAGNQTVVTIHDVVAWTHPGSLPSRRVSWHHAMAKRAHKYADAVVVPTHAIAVALNEIFDFGDRVRVIGGAVSSRLAVPDDAQPRAEELDLPERFILAIGGLESHHGLSHLLAALALPHSGGLPLLVVGPNESEGNTISASAESAGLAPGRVRALGCLSDEDLSVVLDRATMLVIPSLAEGFGMPMLEGFSFGTPVIHSDVPALLEVSGGAGLVVEIGDLESYPQRLLDAISSVDNAPDIEAELSTTGRDRARLFSWQTSAEKVWQLHADL